MKLTTKLSLIVGTIATFVGIFSSYLVIQIAFHLTENKIKTSLVQKYEDIVSLANPNTSTELATFLRSNDLSLMIFTDNKDVVARYGIYRNLTENQLQEFMLLSGYVDKDIYIYGNYDIYTKDNIQISLKNDYMTTLNNAFGINMILLSPIILLVSILSAIYTTKLVLSPLTQAESISHELKTPLTRAVSSLQVVEDSLPARAKKPINEVTRELIQLGDNVDTLLTLSVYKKKYVRGYKHSHFLEEFNKVKDLVPKHIKLDYKIPSSLVAPVPSSLMHIIMRNLLDNASKFNKVGGFILFTVSGNEKNWELEVENSKSNKNTTNSYGIGMTIVKEICHYQKLHFEQSESLESFRIKLWS